MLQRIIDLYRRLWSAPLAVEQLRGEAVTVIAGTSNPVALAGLEQLLFACEEALKVNWWLLMVGD